MSDPALNGGDITGLLLELANQLAPGTRRTIVVVGGALLALHGLREATRDVDTVTAVDEELIGAIERVADLHGLAPRWLNDRARPFLPATFDEGGCEILVDHHALLVLGAPMDQVFLMKLFASRAADVEDIEVMWKHCSYETPEDAAQAFHDAYPHLERDEHLAAFIRRII
ncbi:MAG: DUF6036 family nucleotidyltransferase [Microthrixaceae bacterium]